MASHGPIGKTLKFTGDVAGYVTKPLMGMVEEGDRQLGRVFNPGQFTLVIGPRKISYDTMSQATKAGVNQAHTGIHATFQVIKPGGEVVMFGRDGRIVHENPMEENPSKIWQRLKRMAGHGSSTWIEYANVPKEADAYKVSGKLEAMGVKHTRIEKTKTRYQVLVLREALRAMGAREEAGKKGGTSHLTVSPLTGVQEEVASALVNMGASEKAAREKVKVKWRTGMSFDELFKATSSKANPEGNNYLVRLPGWQPLEIWNAEDEYDAKKRACVIWDLQPLSPKASKIRVEPLPEGGMHSRKSNPADDAALFYESFHGAPSKEVVEIEEEEFYHGHLAELGVLIELQIVTVNGDKAVLTFDAGDGRTKNPAQGDEHAARELELFTENDADLYRQQEQPIQKNLITKMARGIYNHAGAVKLYGYLMESGAKKYVKEHGSPGDVWHEMFNTATRKMAAERFADSFETEAGLGNYDNYLPKKYAGWSGKQWTGRKSNPSDHVDSDTVLLCSSEDGTSLYLMGGDQSVDLSDLAIKHEKDLTVIGDITHIVYRTAKEFDKFEETDYIHEFSEDTGEATPELIYDSKNQKLKIAGGAYKIERPLVGTSAGIEN